MFSVTDVRQSGQPKEQGGGGGPRVKISCVNHNQNFDYLL